MSGNIITFALAKGRLAEKAVDLLEAAGIDCRNILKPSRKLELFDRSGSYKFIFVKPTDVPTYVENGAADIGICGKDTLLELDKNIYELLDLKFAACRLCLAGFSDMRPRLFEQGLRVATKYAGIAKRYFEARGQNVQIIKLNGSIELGPMIGLSDIILDIVESGKTLEENNLEVLEEICPVSARLVVNKVSLKTKADKIKPLVARLQTIIAESSTPAPAPKKEKETLIQTYRYGQDDVSRVFGRSQLNDRSVQKSVKQILSAVSERGDEALFEYTKQFDGLEIDAGSIAVSEAEIEAAYRAVDPALLEAIRRAKENVLDYHNRQTAQFKNNIYEQNNNRLGWIYRPLSRAGIYVPGGKAAYPSSILMCVLPAVAAGVQEIFVATPNPRNPLTLVTARECGVDKIYKIGGAQAVGAFAYGTDSVPQVDIIAGPGNVYVTCAKKEVFGNVAIDMLAGPSEILIIADDTANAKAVAADMLSQAEHDEWAASFLVTTSEKLARAVPKELERQTKLLDRQPIIRRSLADNGAILLVKDMEDAIAISDRIAPEHLEICTKNAAEIAMRIQNAGAVFVGNYSPEPLGDYYAGPSHCLPTSGTARFFSVLSVDTFMKKISYIEYTRENLLQAADDIMSIAKSEGLDAHAATIAVRKEEEQL